MFARGADAHVGAGGAGGARAGAAARIVRARAASWVCAACVGAVRTLAVCTAPALGKSRGHAGVG